MSDAAPDPFPELGEIVDGHTVRFRRLLPVPIDAAWQAVTTSAGLASWLGDATVQPVTGGAFSIRFDATGGVSGERGGVTGEVARSDPPGLVELTWREEPGPDVESSVRIELDPVGPSSRLILTHRDLPVEEKYGYAAGWHQHLARLDAALAGRDDPGWDDVRQVTLSVQYRTEAGPPPG